MKTAFESIRVFLWKLTSSRKCPICKGLATEHGFYRHFTCDNPRCVFNEN